MPEVPHSKATLYWLVFKMLQNRVSFISLILCLINVPSKPGCSHFGHLPTITHSYLYLQVSPHAQCITKEAYTFLLHVGRSFSKGQLVQIWADPSLLPLPRWGWRWGAVHLHTDLWNSGVLGLGTRRTICTEHLNSLVEKALEQIWAERPLGQQRVTLPNKAEFLRAAQVREKIPAPLGQRT